MVRTSNHGPEMKPKYLLLHYTWGASADDPVKWLGDPKSKASTHIVIAQDGRVTQLLPFNLSAWHASKSSWTEPDGTMLQHFNNFAIGVTLDNPGRLALQPHTGEWWSPVIGRRYSRDFGIMLVPPGETIQSGWHVYPQVQLDAAVEVVHAIMTSYGLKDILGGDDVATVHKTGPGPAFPMHEFRARLLGGM
jgi:N-acetylmuramoyl-L-alanine amidase